MRPRLLLCIVTKEELSKRLAKRLSVVETVAATYVDHTLAIMGDELVRGGTITLAGFGRFRVKRYKARTVRSIKDGSPCEIPARMKPVFNPSRKLVKQLRKAIPVPSSTDHTGPDLFTTERN